MSIQKLYNLILDIQKVSTKELSISLMKIMLNVDLS